MQHAWLEGGAQSRDRGKIVSHRDSNISNYTLSFHIFRIVKSQPCESSDRTDVSITRLTAIN